jgi:hypothetical protein
VSLAAAFWARKQKRGSRQPLRLVHHGSCPCGNWHFFGQWCQYQKHRGASSLALDEHNPRVFQELAPEFLSLLRLCGRRQAFGKQESLSDLGDGGIELWATMVGGTWTRP